MPTCSMRPGQSLAPFEPFPHRYGRNNFSPSELELKSISPVGASVACVYEVRVGSGLWLHREAIHGLLWVPQSHLGVESDSVVPG